MAEQARITFAASAIKDFENVQAYYLGEGVPDVGRRLIAELVAKIERLGSHPLSGRVVPEFNVEHLREIITRFFASFIGMIKTRCASFGSGEVKGF